MPESSESTMRNRYAARDGLTAAFTRPYFLNLLRDECRFALEMGMPVSLCLVDFDQLRKVNEEHGVNVGDMMLAEAAESIRSALDLPAWGNLQCVMGRYDGDSLILLLPGCRLDRAEQFAHEIRQRIASLSYEDLSITVSVAVAAFKGDDTVDHLLTRVEKTMCLAKQFGGDGVEVSRTAELTRDLASVTRLPVTWQRRPKRSA